MSPPDLRPMLFVALITTTLSCATGARPRAPDRSAGPVLEEVTLTTDDLAGRIAFFTGALGATPIDEHTLASTELPALLGVAPRSARLARVRLGREVIALRDLDGPSRPVAGDASSRDLSFQHLAIVVSDIDVAWSRVIAAGARPISPAPQRIPDSNPDAGGIRAAYFRDGEGHPLELIWYPRGRGDARWQEPARGLVRGIDHTAIAVSESEASRRFYVEQLGLHVAGTSFNQGIEQERLSGVEGARVRITGLRGTAGPGIELLEYVAPGPGRREPHDPIDLAHVETVLGVPDLDVVAARLGKTPGRCGSCAGGRSTRAIVVRDPDGHALRLQDLLGD